MSDERGNVERGNVERVNVEVPRLRQGPTPEPGNGRKVLIGVAVFFVLLVGFVLTLVFTIGLDNHGVVIPPSPKTTTTQ